MGARLDWSTRPGRCRTRLRLRPFHRRPDLRPNKRQCNPHAFPTNAGDQMFLTECCLCPLSVAEPPTPKPCPSSPFSLSPCSPLPASFRPAVAVRTREICKRIAAFPFQCPLSLLCWRGRSACHGWKPPPPRRLFVHRVRRRLPGPRRPPRRGLAC